ncbi:TspO/MBR family protein [Kribbella sp. CA-247076]|uniref:TspO/MBR family protein n=1 Tax=Kribbella sp. CA-247076 TaxID=3239941 RepID=UPI003D8D9157
MTTYTDHQPARKLGALLVFAAAVAVAALVGALGVTGTSTEYQTLDRPGWAPPSAVFGPVWTVLYATIAVSGWLVWRRVGWSRELAPYAVQLALNALWTPLFFGAGARGLALIDIIALWLAIGWTVLRFRPISTPATLLLIPYWAWTSYALALNAAVWTLNR